MKRLILFLICLSALTSNAAIDGGAFGKKWTVSGLYNMTYGQYIIDFAREYPNFKTLKNVEFRVERTLNRKISYYVQNSMYKSDMNIKYQTISSAGIYSSESRDFTTFNNYTVFGIKKHSPSSGEINPLGTYFAYGVYFGLTGINIATSDMQPLGIKSGYHSIKSFGGHVELGYTLPISRSISITGALSALVRVPRYLMTLEKYISPQYTAKENLKSFNALVYNRFRGETAYNIKIGINYHF